MNEMRAGDPATSRTIFAPLELRRAMNEVEFLVCIEWIGMKRRGHTHF